MSALRSLLLFLALGLCAVVADAAERPMVAVSVLPQAWLVEEIAGERVEIEVMIPPGASPATHEPTIRQRRALEEASLYVKVGHPRFPFEQAWLDRLLSERKDLPIVDSSAGVEVRERDPHVWVAPGAMRKMAENVTEALAALMPDEADSLRARNADLDRRIAELDRDIRTALAGHEGAAFFVYHAAWGYFADEYGLEQIAMEKGSRQPSPAQIAALIDAARERGIRVVFVQPQFSARSAELIAQEIGGRVVPLDPLARDWLANMRRVAEAMRAVFAESAKG